MKKEIDNQARLKSFNPDVVFTNQAHLILSYVIKIPSNLGRLAGLGPSAGTSAKSKKQFLRLSTPRQSERYLVRN